ncbi:MAG: hypothetical protein B5M55_08305 [Desulfococcus sp. 4484_242]|nr:MAG: hypothetical protein B5M55_08305 [Desulfococcus sp. 4484_242]
MILVNQLYTQIPLLTTAIFHRHIACLGAVAVFHVFYRKAPWKPQLDEVENAKGASVPRR